MRNPFKKKQNIDEEIAKLKELLDLHAEATKLGLTPTGAVGNGKAEFLGSGTEDEFKQQENADKGWKGIFGL